MGDSVTLDTKARNKRHKPNHSSKTSPPRTGIGPKLKQTLSVDNLELSLLALPTFIWYILFAYLPMFGIFIAFVRYKPIRGVNFFTSLFRSEFVGLYNFRYLFTTPDAALVFRNTLLYNIVFIALGVIVPLSLAVMMSQLHSQKLAKVCQTAIFLPYFLSWVVVSYFGMAFMSVNKGLVNQILTSAGGSPVQWYMSPQYWPYLLIGINLWKNVGYGMVLYLASITNIDATLYEAAVVDGASKWQQVKHITLPLLKPMVIILFILSVGGIFYSDFGLFYIMPRDQGALSNVTQTIDVYVYKALMRMNNIGFASAASFLQSVFGFITIYVANAVVKKLDPERGLF